MKPESEREPMNQPFIKTTNLTRQFPGHGYALSQVDFELHRGETVGLIGRNGAGKTTLIRTMLGLAIADTGTASTFGEEARHLSAAAKQRIGYVPQIAGLPLDHRVSGVLDMYRRWQPHWNPAFAESLLQRFALESRQRIGDLSSGQLQRLSLLLALAHSPDLLVLDEPVAALDPIARRDVASLLAERQAENGMSILFSTHILSDLERLATHIAVMDHGRLRFLRETDALKEDIEFWELPPDTSPENLRSFRDFPGLLARPQTPAPGFLVDCTQGTARQTLETRLGRPLVARKLALEDFVIGMLQ